MYSKEKDFEVLNEWIEKNQATMDSYLNMVGGKGEHVKEGIFKESLVREMCEKDKFEEVVLAKGEETMLELETDLFFEFHRIVHSYYPLWLKALKKENYLEDEHSKQILSSLVKLIAKMGDPPATVLAPSSLLASFSTPSVPLSLQINSQTITQSNFQANSEEEKEEEEGEDEERDQNNQNVGEKGEVDLEKKKEMEEANFLYLGPPDKAGRIVLYFITNKFKSYFFQHAPTLLEHLRDMFSLILKSSPQTPYSLLVDLAWSDLGRDLLKQGISFLHSFWWQLERSWKKNVSAIYILYPSKISTPLLFLFDAFTSKKSVRKVHKIRRFE